MKVLQVNGSWQTDGSFKVRNLQQIQDSSNNYDDWNTITNILKMIIQSLLLYQSEDGYIYISQDGYAYTNKN